MPPFPRCEIGGIESTYGCVVDHDSAGQVVTVTARALGDCLDEVLALGN